MADDQETVVNVTKNNCGQLPDFKFKITQKSSIYVKDVSCIYHLCFVQNVINVPIVVPDLPVGANCTNFGKYGEPWGLSKCYSSPRRWLHCTLLDLTKSDKVTQHHKLLCISPQEHLMESLHARMQKNAVEPFTTQKSLGFYHRLFVVPKPNN